MGATSLVKVRGAGFVAAELSAVSAPAQVTSFLNDNIPSTRLYEPLRKSDPFEWTRPEVTSVRYAPIVPRRLARAHSTDRLLPAGDGMRVRVRGSGPHPETSPSRPAHRQP